MKVDAFVEIAAEFVERAHRTVWCNLATLDTRGRPRSRIVHPIWEDGTGWVVSRLASPKAKEIEHSPYVSLAYVADAVKPLYVDCIAAWDADLEHKRHVCALFKSAPPPLGYDVSTIFATVEHPNFGLLRLTPWRVQLDDMTGGDAAAGLAQECGAMITGPEIERYCEEHTTPAAELLTTVEADTRANVPRGSNMITGFLEGRFLEMLVYLSGARTVLEVGTLTGYGALAMAAALPLGGRVITCELDPENAAIARRNFAASPYGDRIELRLGPALESITALPGPFDLVFVDADKRSYRDYYEAVLPKLGERGLLVIDNTLWYERVLQSVAADDADTRAMVALNDFIRADDRVVAVMLPVRDGITLVRRSVPGS